jgi:4-hydroxy-2-oxoheptanedioate aldolase
MPSANPQAGKAPGILMANEQLAKRYLELGALFVAVGVDTTLLARGAKRWRHALSNNRLRQ